MKNRLAILGRVLGLAIGLGPGIAASAAAQQYPSHTFMAIQGGDTLATEVVTRTPTWVSGDMILRAQGMRARYTAQIDPDGLVPTITTALYRNEGDSVPSTTVVAEFVGDSVRVEIGGELSNTLTVESRAGALPIFMRSSALIEQLLRRSRTRGGATDTVPLFNVQNGQTALAVVTWNAADTAVVRIDADGTELRAVLHDGSLLRLDVGENVRVVRLDGAHPLKTESIDYGPPPGAPYSAEEVAVRTPAGLELNGTLTLPAERSGPVPAVYTITGSGKQDRDGRLPGVGGYRPFWEIADTLARRGIATLRLDDRGFYDSDRGPGDATSADLADDVRTALAYLRDRPEIDDERLGLVGHSEGGMIAPMVAATHSSLAGIVLMAAPGYVGRRVIETQRVADMDPSIQRTPEERRQIIERRRRADERRRARNPHFRFFLEYDPISTARRVSVPVLILQGETDRQVTPEQADTLAAAFRAGGNPDVTVRTFPDTNHLFLADSVGWSGGYALLPSKEVRPEVLGAIADWLAARLK